MSIVFGYGCFQVIVAIMAILILHPTLNMYLMAINKYIAWRLNIGRFGKSDGKKYLLKYWPISQLQHQEQAILHIRK